MAFVDLTGQRFGKLTAIKRAANKTFENEPPQIQYLCRCDCGVERIFSAKNLKNGASKSCGCSRFKKWEEKRYKVSRGSGWGGEDRPIDGYINLANAIIEMAAKDYKAVYKSYLLAPNSKEANRRLQQERKFFYSPLYGVLTTYDGDMLLERLEREVMNSFKRGRKS